MTIIYVKDGETFYIPDASEVIVKSTTERSMEAHSEDDGSSVFRIKENNN